MTRAGLLVKGSNEQLPLKGVQISAAIKDFAATVFLNQTFWNNQNHPLEVCYDFPVPPQAAVCEFEARINGKIIVGAVEENDKAQNKYDDAIASGRSAYMMSNKRSDLMSLSIGNLPPGTCVTIRIGYVTELSIGNRDTREIRFAIPLALAAQLAADMSAAGGIQPPPSAQTDTPGITVTVDIEMQSVLLSVQCSSHANAHTLMSAPNKSSVRWQHNSGSLQRDFVVNIVPVAAEKPSVWLEPASKISPSASSAEDAVMLSFFPNFEAAKTTTSANINTEIIILLDRSGSMAGTPIRVASQTVCAVVNRLPSNVYFNIVGFGSHYQKLFTDAVPATEEFKAKVREHCEKLSADLGGTELYGPLQDVLKGQRGDRVRQLFVLTDGQVSNPSDCIELVRMHSSFVRCFTFGIGSSFAESLVSGIATASNGFSETVRDVTAELDTIVQRQLTRALCTSLYDVKLEWNPPCPEISVAPLLLPPVFSRERYLLYAFIPPSYRRTNPNATVTLIAKGATTEGSAEQNTVTYVLRLADAKELTTDSACIHRLAAKKMIDELGPTAPLGRTLSAEVAKRRMITLSKQYNIACKHTSFLAIDQQSPAQATEESMRKVVVPTPIASPSSPQYNDRFRSLAPARFQSLGAQRSADLADLQQRVQEVRNIMKDNVDCIIMRGEKLDRIEANVTMACSLADESSSFFMKASSLQYRMRRKRLIVVGGCILFLLLLGCLVFLVYWFAIRKQK